MQVSEATDEVTRHVHALLDSCKATVGIIGLGYVGLPLAVAAHRAGFSIIGFDIDSHRVDVINSGNSPMTTLTSTKVAEMLKEKRFRATTDYSEIAKVDVIIICVPTPLTVHREPDLSFIESTAEWIAPNLKSGQLVVLESTTYPGTTREVLKTILQTRGLKSGSDFYLAYAPEREDPGNANYETSTIPRVVGADDPKSLLLAATLYKKIVGNVVTVSSTSTAEAVKLTENIFRLVNIALVNELKVIFGQMGINIWEVIDAAKTKPFGFMPFYPGPGLGGHCIPIDPLYLTWKAREYNVPTRFIELAAEVNADARRYVVQKTADALSMQLKKSLNGSRVLLLGLAYKKNVDDMRESPSLVIFEDLEKRGALVEYYDPYIQRIPMTREHAALAGRTSVAWTKDIIGSFDVAVICTDHDGVNYAELTEYVPLIVDTRNATRGLTADNIVFA